MFVAMSPTAIAGLNKEQAVSRLVYLKNQLLEAVFGNDGGNSTAVKLPVNEPGVTAKILEEIRQIQMLHLDG